MKKVKASFLLLSLYLLLILGLGIIYYNDDLLDSNSPIVIVSQAPFIYPNYDGIARIKLIRESFILPLINKNLFLTRAPPV